VAGALASEEMEWITVIPRKWVPVAFMVIPSIQIMKVKLLGLDCFFITPHKPLFLPVQSGFV
jgi:hypothetical protein